MSGDPVSRGRLEYALFHRRRNDLGGYCIDHLICDRVVNESPTVLDEFNRALVDIERLSLNDGVLKVSGDDSELRIRIASGAELLLYRYSVGDRVYPASGGDAQDRQAMDLVRTLPSSGILREYVRHTGAEVRQFEIGM